MFFVRIPVEAQEIDELTAELWDAGTLGIVEGEGFLDAFFEDRSAGGALRDSAGISRHRLGALDRRSLASAAGRREVLRGRSLAHRTHARRPLPVRNQSRHAVRNGSASLHAAMPGSDGKIIRPGDRVLDVGTGSGILSLAAKMLGAGRVIACDIDPDAAPARGTSADDMVPFFVGSADAVRDGAFDVVVANISETVIEDLHPELRARRPSANSFGISRRQGRMDLCGGVRLRAPVCAKHSKTVIPSEVVNE